MKKAIFAALVLGLLSGCSMAGPFVTNISSDGEGGLIVNKMMVEFNGFTGTVTNKDMTTETIKLRPRK